MLLIVFIENAFKHSKNTNDKKIFINIELKHKGNYILFSISNSCAESEGRSASPNEHKGLGLNNAKKRLELLYPNAHHLKLENDGKYFSVILGLKQK